MLAEPGYGEDIRCHGFVPYAAAPLKPPTVGSAPSSPLKMTDQRWVFPPDVQRSLEKTFYSVDATPRLGTYYVYIRDTGSALTLATESGLGQISATN